LEGLDRQSKEKRRCAWRGCEAEWVRQPIMVESDCQNLIQDVQGPIDARASQAGMLKEIKGAIRLPGCKLIMFEVAHVLAQRAGRWQECVAMRLDVPEFVRDIVPREGEEAVRLARACNRSNPVINERSGVLRKKRRNQYEIQFDPTNGNWNIQRNRTKFT
jgi:hypothetical protein